MNSMRQRLALCLLALLATCTLSGCMAHRPHPYNRPSFHASLNRSHRDSVPPTQLARWHRTSDEPIVATAKTTANSPTELTINEHR